MQLAEDGGEDQLQYGGQLLGPPLRAEFGGQRLGQRGEAGDVGEQRRTLDTVGQLAAGARRRSPAMYASGSSRIPLPRTLDLPGAGDGTIPLCR